MSSQSCVFWVLFVAFSLCRVLSEAEHATLPPRGWNSYDSFSWIVSEEEFLQSSDIISKRLKPHGYEYVVVDFLWYRKKVPGSYTDAYGFDVIDEWGRMVPDPDRWPSSRGGKGFTEVANKVHSMGLKFGIHVMRGLSRQAYDANTPILDTTTGGAFIGSGKKWHAQDIGIKERACAWMQHGFMSVNTKSEAGRAFLRSLYEQYAGWGVDFVKHDCVFGDDLDIDEIAYVSEVLQKLQRPILYSLSPGTGVTPAMAKDVIGLVNMYRITGDDWDTWGDVTSHFDVSRDFATAKMIGAKGLLGKSWPDLDMLPLGWLTDPGANQGPHRQCNLNVDEKKTQMTLWAMAKSPLMYGGDVRKLDDTTYSLITNPTVLEINSFSSNNMEFPYITEGGCAATRTKYWARKSRRSLKEVDASPAHFLGLTSCNDPNATGWSTEVLDQDLWQICWKESLGSLQPLCLYSRRPRLSSDEQLVLDEERLHLFASDGIDNCLDAALNRKLTSKESKKGLFSPCKRNTNQLQQKWELIDNGALVSSYSGLCAVANKVHAKVDHSGARSWIATGRKGEIYVALFNLNSEKTVICTKIADIGKMLPGRNLDNASCKYAEVWSGKDEGVTKSSISMEVESHGCALLVLNCAY